MDTNVNAQMEYDDSQLISVNIDDGVVMLPMFGGRVPVPITAVRNVSYTPVDGDYAYLRINLLFPGSNVGGKPGGGEAAKFPHPEANFIKEITFKSSNKTAQGKRVAPSAELCAAYREIRAARDEYRRQETEAEQKRGAAKQDELVRKQNDVPKLRDLIVRPSLASTRKLMGTLEAHSNGFEYTTKRGDTVHFCYNMVKHAFFQPCEKELIAVLHFQFKEPLLFGKKKFKEIQFYSETVGEAVTDLTRYHHMMDRDDVEREIECEAKQRRDGDIKTFCDKVAELSNGAIEFEVPNDEMAFKGSVGHNMVRIKPTATCLVQLVEWPSFVVAISEIEWVHFERLVRNRGTSGFDMVLIFKDHSIKPIQIGQIHHCFQDKVQTWLQGCGIPQSKGIISLNWPKIMKTVVDDPESFVEDGGWKGILGDDDEDSSGSGEESGSDYQPSNSADEDDDEIIDIDDDSGEEEEEEEDDDDDDGDESE